MIWQDIVIIIAVFGFSLATLHFWLSLAANITNTVTWAVLLFQKRS